MNKDNKRVLAVGAHPDDIEFIAAGTLALLYQKGFEISITTICSGDKGSAELTPQEISSMRYSEAKESAKILNASFTTLGEPDMELIFERTVRLKAVELIRKTDPTIVITNSPRDYMRDHEITADLLWDSCFNAPARNYTTNQPNPAKPIEKIPFLFYGDTIGGIDRFGMKVTVEFYVDITSIIEIKEKMLAKHESQRS